MDKGTVLRIIADFKKLLESKAIKVDRIILYGSYASGKFREGSDIDILVISDDFKNKNYWERIDILSEVIYEVFKPIEAVAMTLDEWERGDSVIAGFAQKGEVITGSGFEC